MSANRSSRLRLAAVAAATLTATLVLPAPADAATAPLATRPTCYAEGAGLFFCTAGLSGGTAPYTTAWSGAAFHQNTGGVASGTCSPDRLYRVTATVTDAVGAQASAVAAFYCRGGQPV